MDNDIAGYCRPLLCIIQPLKIINYFSSHKLQLKTQHAQSRGLSKVTAYQKRNQKPYIDADNEISLIWKTLHRKLTIHEPAPL